MTDPRENAITDHLQRSLDVIKHAADDFNFRAAVLAISEAIVHAFKNGGKLLLAGNGGSAADAQHIAAEFLSRFGMERRPLPAIALNTCTSVMTAIGNDYGFERIFERQIRGLGRPGDVFIAISTSGRSPNVLSALKAARETGLVTIGFTGAGGDMRPLCDLVLAAPSQTTALIQQVHIIAAHAICGLVEQELFAKPGP
jgi:D-sedoheptulose 7-phosphate isomerase